MCETFFQQSEDKLRPSLDDKFLSTLVEAAKTCGWSVDHTATVYFVRWCHEVAGVKCPDIEVYEPEGVDDD